MKRMRVLVLLLVCCMLTVPGISESVILRTASCFAGTDDAAAAYVNILREYETRTGNVVEDVSAPSDETWKSKVLSDFAAGNEPDVLFFFAANADSTPILYRVVPLDEIMADYPDIHLPETEAIREANGHVYAVPARSYWEGLYLNTDLFEAQNIPIPTDWESFITAIQAFRDAGVVPIAISFSDIPHYLAEFAILSCATYEEQRARPETLDEVPESWYNAMALIRELYEIGAFASDAAATTEAASTELFRTKKAAMQIDGSWLAASLPAENMASTGVIAVPMKAGNGLSPVTIGGISMGFYLTRRAYSSPIRREPSVELFSALTDPENLRKLENTAITGQLEKYADVLTAPERPLCSPLQDAMNKEARETWLLECIPAVATGTMTPEECWARVMALHPFDSAKEEQ